MTRDESGDEIWQAHIRGTWRIALVGLVDAFVGGGIVALVLRVTGILGPVTEYGILADAAILSVVLIVLVIGVATVAGVAISEAIKRSNSPNQDMALSAEDLDE